MPLPPRIIGYDGDDPVQIVEHFEMDSRGAEEHDWYPISQTWTDGVLFVEYEHDPDRRLRASVKLAAGARPGMGLPQRVRQGARNGGSWVPSLVVVGLIVAAVVGVSMIAFTPGDRATDLTGDTAARATPTATVGAQPAGGSDPTGAPGRATQDPEASSRPSAERSPGVRSGSSTRTFKDGIWEVGEDIEPGTYRTLGAEGCYWSRLRRLTGRQRDVIVERSVAGPTIVTVRRRDVGFESARCRSWTSDLSRITESRTEFGDGTYLVGADVAAGTYRSRSTTPCRWERLSGFTGDRGDVIASGREKGRRTVTIRGPDAGFSTAGCGTWTRLRG